MSLQRLWCRLFHPRRRIEESVAIGAAGTLYRHGWECQRCDWCRINFEVSGLSEEEDLRLRSALDQLVACAEDNGGRVRWRSVERDV